MKRLPFILIIILAIFVGCDTLGDNPITEDTLDFNFEYEFNKDVRFYGDELSAHVSLINDTTMLVEATMPSEHVPQVGDVILCPSTVSTPHGFLRRVESIDMGVNGLIVNTTPATLADAFQTLQFEQTFNYADCVKEFRDSLGNQIAFELLNGSVMEQLDTIKANSPTKARGEGDLGTKSLKFDVSNRFFSGSAYIESQIYVKFDIGFGKVEVSYEIDKQVGLKGKAFISSSELIGTDYEDDFSFTIVDKNIPFGTPLGPPLMQFFPSLDFGIALVGNGNMSLEGEINYVLEDTKSRYTYKNGVEHKEVINNLNSNSSWMKMVALEVEGEFGLQGSVGMELRLWNGDLLAFGGEGALWYGLTAEAGISMSDQSLLISNPALTVAPKLSAALYIESYFINNRKHRIEAKVERSFEGFDIRILPELKYEEEKIDDKLTIKSTIEPISMIEVSEQGFALFNDKSPGTPVTHQSLPSSTIIDAVPTAPYKDIQLEPTEVTFILSADAEEEYFVKPYVIADGQYYYGEGDDNCWVDLGLPSGILWAKFNVGASSPEEYGDYYAWGETEEKEGYSSDNYLANDIEECICCTRYDVATVKWGDRARMPTIENIIELFDYSTFEIIRYNDKLGYNIKGPNGNTIFFPLAGYHGATAAVGENYIGYYWTGSYSAEKYAPYALYFQSPSAYVYDYSQRYHGFPVRPVKDKK